MRHFTALLVTILAAVPAVQAQDAACKTTVPDSLARATPPAYSECQVTRPAERQGEHRTLSFAPSELTQALRMGCLRASVGFVVDVRGRVEEETAALLETNFPEFGRAVLATLGRLRYQPAQLDGQPVRQWTTYHREGEPSRVGPIRVYSSDLPASARPMADPPRVTVGPSC